MKTRYLYEVVTPDRYELPLCVADSIGELALLTGRDYNTVHKGVMRAFRSRNRGKGIYRVVWI